MRAGGLKRGPPLPYNKAAWNVSSPSAPTARLEELEAGEVATEYESLKARAKAMDVKFNEAIEVVKAANNNEFTDLCSRHLYAVSRKRLVLTSRVGESEA